METTQGSVKTAVLLAGGKGRRLAPYTTILPKPLMPVGEMPILEVLIRQLAYYEFKRVILCVGYLGGLLEAYFGNGSKWGVNLTYSYESEPLGTAGPLALIERPTAPFLVMNGDLLTTLDFNKLYTAHTASPDRDVTIALYERNVKIDLGVIELGPQNELKEYREKPKLDFLVSMGIYVFQPVVLSKISGYLDLPDLMTTLKNEGRSVIGYREPCDWLDIGNPDDYAKALDWFENEPKRFLR